MVKKKNRGMSGYVGDVMLAGTVTGTLERSTGYGTGMTSTFVNASARPIAPVMKIKSTGMVLKAVSKIKPPRFKKKKKGGRK